MQNKKINDYILYLFLKKIYLYSYSGITDFIKIFNQLPYDYLLEYIKPIIYILDNSKDKKDIIKFMNYYYKNRKKYPKKYMINKLELKIIRLILKEELNKSNFYKNIKSLNYKNDFNNEINNRTNFMYKKAIEFINNKK